MFGISILPGTVLSGTVPVMNQYPYDRYINSLNIFLGNIFNFGASKKAQTLQADGSPTRDYKPLEILLMKVSMFRRESFEIVGHVSPRAEVYTEITICVFLLDS